MLVRQAYRRQVQPSQIVADWLTSLQHQLSTQPERSMSMFMHTQHACHCVTILAGKPARCLAPSRHSTHLKGPRGTVGEFAKRGTSGPPSSYGCLVCPCRSWEPLLSDTGSKLRWLSPCSLRALRLSTRNMPNAAPARSKVPATTLGATTAARFVLDSWPLGAATAAWCGLIRRAICSSHAAAETNLRILACRDAR